MIVSFDNCDGTVRTNGCGCCSADYDIIEQKDIVLDELRDNIKVVKECLDFLDIDFDEFVKNI